MSGLTVGLAAAAGVVLSPALRVGIARHAVPEGTAWRHVCPGCGVRFDVLALSGRCRGCRTRLGPPTGTVECAAAAGLALIAWGLAGAPGWTSAAMAWLVLVGVVLVFVDLAVQRLPDPLTGAAAGGVFVLLAAERDPGRLGLAVLCGLAAAACYLVLAFVMPSGMGLGDVKLALPLGLALGWWGGTVTLLGVAAGFLLHAALTVALLTFRRIGWRGQLPHGPAMIVGTVASLALFGH